MRKILFTKHAEAKMALLAEHGFRVTKSKVEGTLRDPQRISPGYKGRKIAERSISEEHLLRVVYEESFREVKVITLYPARRDRYED